MTENVNATTTLQPYEFLGVSPNSSLQEVRRAYYRLSLICHPDHGGSPEQMITLQAAYQWIKHQLETVQNRTDATMTYEERKDDFAAFLASQTATDRPRLIPFNELEGEAFGIPRTDFDRIYDEFVTQPHHPFRDGSYRNSVFQQVVSHLRWNALTGGTPIESQEAIRSVIEDYIKSLQKAAESPWMYASIPNGYGYKMTSNADPDVPFDANQHFGTEELILYEEPRHYIAPSRPTEAPVQLPSRLDDFSMDYGPADYCQAYKETNRPLQKLEDAVKAHADVPLDHVLEQKQLERQFMDTQIMNAPPPVIEINKINQL